MQASKHVRRVRRHHDHYRRGRHDLNIVPMIDMMVILVFFLIFTAVFSKTTILELNLPASNSSVPDLPPGLQLEVIVRPDRLDVSDRNTGLLKSIPGVAGGYDYPGLGGFLQAVKAKFPELKDATILLDPDIPYDVLVQVMDTVRVRDGATPAAGRIELFPNISVGDAPK